jgi:hypothetical protein
MEVKTVIANRAVGDWGKSTSLKQVYETLKVKYPNMTPKTTLINDGDIKAIFTIGNIKIGFETQGDPYSRIFQSIDDFVNESCDLIICACRTRGATIEKIRSLRKFDYRIIWSPNISCDQKSTHKVLNDLYVISIADIIDALLNENL